MSAHKVNKYIQVHVHVLASSKEETTYVFLGIRIQSTMAAAPREKNLLPEDINSFC